MGKVYKYYPVKPVFLTSILLFEIGSAVCGAAPNSTAFIIGRAISGLGASGLFPGMMVIMVHTIPLRQRPIWQGNFGAIFAIASVIGPLIGGAFTDSLTWRWCFYINLPVGAVSIIVTAFILRLSNQKLSTPAPGFIGKLKQLDPIGTLVFLPGIICLVLALQWGGSQYSWKNARIIVLLVLCAILCLAFIGVQIWKQEDATVPPRIMMQRSIAATVWFSFFSGAGMMVAMYYLPIWFQAIKGVDAIKSGIMLLPLVLSSVFCSIFSGVIISKLGYYTPFFILSSVIMPIGAGLIATFTSTTGHPEWIGWQVLFGVGLGLGMQQHLNVVQTVLERSDIAAGSSLVMFVRFLGSAIFLQVAENIFLGGLVSKLSNLPQIDSSTVTGAGATQLRNLASGNDLKTLLTDYNGAIVNVFYLVTATCAATILGSVFVEWRSLKAKSEKEKGNSKEAGEQGEHEVKDA